MGSIGKGSMWLQGLVKGAPGFQSPSHLMSCIMRRRGAEANNFIKWTEQRQRIPHTYS